MMRILQDSLDHGLMVWLDDVLKNATSIEDLHRL